MQWEKGLYGQSERTAAIDSANEERILDVYAERAAHSRHVRVEQYYRDIMGRIVLAEMDTSRMTAQFRTEHNKQYTKSFEHDTPLGDFLSRVLDLVVDLPRERQKQLFQRLGRVANFMLAQGFHRSRVGIALNCAVPIALNMRRERKLDRDGIIEHADKPRSRVGRRAQVMKGNVIPIGKPARPGSLLEALLNR